MWVQNQSFCRDEDLKTLTFSAVESTKQQIHSDTYVRLTYVRMTLIETVLKNCSDHKMYIKSMYNKDFVRHKRVFNQAFSF